MIQVHTHLVVPGHLADDPTHRREVFGAAARAMREAAAELRCVVLAETTKSLVVRPAPDVAQRPDVELVVLPSGEQVELPAGAVCWEFSAGIARRPAPTGPDSVADALREWAEPNDELGWVGSVEVHRHADELSARLSDLALTR